MVNQNEYFYRYLSAVSIVVLTFLFFTEQISGGFGTAYNHMIQSSFSAVENHERVLYFFSEFYDLDQVLIEASIRFLDYMTWLFVGFSPFLYYKLKAGILDQHIDNHNNWRA